MFARIKKGIEPHQMRKWVAQAAVGIDALHQMGIIHRDIKPGNVLVDAHETVRITDFGSAYTYNRAVTRLDKFPQEPFGTPEYCAPEVLRKEPFGLLVDYWGLGITVYNMLTFEVSFGLPSLLILANLAQNPC